MFTQKEMTEAHREYINSLLDDLYGRYGIAKGRNKSVDESREIIDNAPNNGPGEEAGLIDGAMYRDVDKELKKRLGYKDSDNLRVASAGYRKIAVARPEQGREDRHRLCRRRHVPAAPPLDLPAAKPSA
jgi:hypothetical protein